MSTELQHGWIQAIVCEVGSEYMCGRRKMRSSKLYLQKKHEYEFRHILLLKLHHSFATGSFRTNGLQMKQNEGVSPSYFLHCCQSSCMTAWPRDVGLGMQNMGTRLFLVVSRPWIPTKLGVHFLPRAYLAWIKVKQKKRKFHMDLLARYSGEKLKCRAGYQVFFSIKILLSSKYHYLKKDPRTMQKATARVVCSCSNTI